MTNHAVKQTAGRDQLGDFAPKFAELNDDVLFGQVWSRDSELNLRDRSLVTVVALMAQGLVDSSFEYHLQTAKNNGISRLEIAEILTHAAFYAGWPKAWAAFRLATKVWNQNETPKEASSTNAIMNIDNLKPVTEANTSNITSVISDSVPSGKAEHQAQMVFPIGEANDGFARYFIGQSYLAPLTGQQVPTSNVTFEPGCRNNWHIHHADEGGGQMLICVAGTGWYQEWGQLAQKLYPGDVVNIPAGVKHWHGATANSWFSHLALAVPGSNESNEWLEPVDDAHYNSLTEN